MDYELELKKWVDDVLEAGHSEKELGDFLSKNVSSVEKEKIFELYRKEKKAYDSKKFKEHLEKDLTIEEPRLKLSPEELKFCTDSIYKLKSEISKVVVGQEKIIHGVILGLLCKGHVLLEGVPGIAKTLMVKAIGKASGCKVKRVQFTVDLLPTDILGLTTYDPKKGFEIEKGPIFTNFLIADEINRSPPKTQSALIEAMQEEQVTLGKKTFKLPAPFFVMATMNPLENAGVYPLPEAQVDRFLFKLKVNYPEEKDELKIMEHNTSFMNFDDMGIKSVISPKDLMKMQELVQKVHLGESIKKYILKIVRRTRDKDFKYAEFLDYGVSPRSSISFFIAAKANALADGRDFVLPEDVDSVVFDILRHRLLLSYKATVHNLDSEQIIKELLKEVKG